MWGPVKNWVWFSWETPGWQRQFPKGLVHSSGWASCWKQCSAPRRVTGQCSCQSPSITHHPSYGQCQPKLSRTRSWRKGSAPSLAEVDVQLCAASSFFSGAAGRFRALRFSLAWPVEKKEWEKERERQKLIPTQCILRFYDFISVTDLQKKSLSRNENVKSELEEE